MNQQGGKTESEEQQKGEETEEDNNFDVFDMSKFQDINNKLNQKRKKKNRRSLTN